MRKKTAPHTQGHRKTSTSRPSGLTVKGEKPQRSAGRGSALDSRSHRTFLRVTARAFARSAPLR